MTGAVDLQELRRSLGQFTRGELLIVAQRAAEIVPAGALPSLLNGLIELRSGLALAHKPATLLDEVQRICAEGIGGKLCVSFELNSRNCSEQSRGTDAFIAEFDRLIAKCVRAAETGRCPWHRHSRPSLPCCEPSTQAMTTCSSSQMKVAHEASMWTATRPCRATSCAWRKRRRPGTT